MASSPAFRYPYNIQTTLEPWREVVGPNFDKVVTLLTDRDRAIEDYVNRIIYDRVNSLVTFGGGEVINLGPWIDYVPTLTNMTLGNGVVVAKYAKSGRTVNLRFTFTLGSTSTMGTGPIFSLPVPCANVGGHLIGSCMMTDVTTNIYLGFAQVNNTGGTGNAASLRAINVAGTYANFADITALVPMTWANGHWIDVLLAYEAAS